MRTKLQNNPTSTVYPVRFNRRAVKSVAAVSAHATEIERNIFIAVLTLFCPAVVGLSIFWRAGFNSPFFVFALAILVLTSVIGALVLYRVGNRDRVNQRKYYVLGRVNDLTDEQAQALQLMTFSDFVAGTWNETLEYYPMATKMQGEYLFNFSLSDAKDVREALYQDWGITDKASYKRRLDELLNGGDEVRRFLSQYVFAPHGIAGLSAISGFEPAQIGQYLLASNGTRKLTWGFEIWRAVRLARTAYMAEYVTEEEAWQDILTASSYAHTLFDDLDDFNRSELLGRAVWFGDAELMKNETAWYANYQRDCRFSLRFLPWQKQHVQLPASMRGIYAETKDKCRVPEELSQNMQ